MIANRIAALRAWPKWRRSAARLVSGEGVFPWLELASLLLLMTALGVSYSLITRDDMRDKVLPVALTSALLIACLLPAMALMVLLGRRVAKGRAARSASGGKGTMHVRLVGLFSLVAAIPTLLVVIFASLLFQTGSDFWFSDKARGMFANANELARGYYEQNLRDVGNESVAMAGDLRDYLGQARIDSPEFAEGYSFQVVSRQLNESAIIELGRDGVLRTAAIVDPAGDTARQRVTPKMIEQLNKGEQVLVSASANRIEAVTALDGASGIYLYTARNSDQLALSMGERAENVLKDYDSLAKRARSLQLRFNIALFIISLALVGVALWIALRSADRLVGPLDELVQATRTVGTGNFAPRIAALGQQDEIGVLNRAFNRMTEQLASQTQQLVGANAQLENRRAFIEAILESISAGVVSIDDLGRIRLMNSSAQRLLLVDERQDYLGRMLSDISPPIAELARGDASHDIVQISRNKEFMTLSVRCAREPIGQVITFEDISQQLLDQRQAAWSDVARRIAHEIKNPLTPIQLAAERLKRRYRREIQSDPEVFDELTNIIVRQVGDLRNMVDEFSSFARLPKPVFRLENLFELVRQALFMQEVAHPEVDFRLSPEMGDMPLDCDRRQIGQALTNIIKNALEAIESQRANAEPDYRGQIIITVHDSLDAYAITIEDNGIGLPADRERIAEPYMTTREKGTGLGLAIVKKIVEEHHGELAFDNRAEGPGTIVRLTFGRNASARADTAETNATPQSATGKVS